MILASMRILLLCWVGVLMGSKTQGFHLIFGVTTRGRGEQKPAYLEQSGPRGWKQALSPKIGSKSKLYRVCIRVKPFFSASKTENRLFVAFSASRTRSILATAKVLPEVLIGYAPLNLTYLDVIFLHGILIMHQPKNGKPAFSCFFCFCPRDDRYNDPKNYESDHYLSEKTNKKAGFPFVRTWRPRWFGRLSSCLLKSTSRVQFSPSAHAYSQGLFHEQKLISGKRESVS